MVFSEEVGPGSVGLIPILGVKWKDFAIVEGRVGRKDPAKFFSGELSHGLALLASLALRSRLHLLQNSTVQFSFHSKVHIIC